jgi:hypothetical protein
VLVDTLVLEKYIRGPHLPKISLSSQSDSELKLGVRAELKVTHRRSVDGQTATDKCLGVRRTGAVFGSESIAEARTGCLSLQQTNYTTN